MNKQNRIEELEYVLNMYKKTKLILTMNKQNRIEELEYVLNMYKKTKLILDVWDKDDLNNRINKVEQELQELNSQIKPKAKEDKNES